MHLLGQPAEQTRAAAAYISYRTVTHRRWGWAESKIDARWDDNDYAIIDNTIVVGRIYKEMIIGKPKWRWFVRQILEAGPRRPIQPPSQGMADTLDEAKAAFL